MKIADLITLAEHKLVALNNEMSVAVQLGEVDEVTRLEGLVVETQQTLDTLRAAT